MDVTRARELPVFRDADPERLAQVAHRLREIPFAAGDRIHNQGDACDRVVVVTDGEVRVSKVAGTGREIQLYRIRPGEPCVLELSAAMGRSPYPARAIASTAGTAVSIPADLLQELIATDTAVREFVFSTLSTRLTEVMTLVEEVAFSQMDQRLARFLAREATGKPPTVHMTHEGIADRLGTAREVVSRLLEQMADDGRIVLGRGEVRLMEPPTLAS